MINIRWTQESATGSVTLTFRTDRLEETVTLRPAPKKEPYVGFDGSVTFYDLAPGRYEVLVQSGKKSEPWVSLPVPPGTRVQAPSMRLLHQGYFGD